MDAEIRVDSDELGVKGRMVELRQRQAIRDNRLPSLLVRINDDVRRHRRWRREICVSQGQSSLSTLIQQSFRPKPNIDPSSGLWP